MSNKNKGVRQELERLYGSKDMFKAARVEEQIDTINETRRIKIKTYREYKQKAHFKASKEKSLERLLSLHHLQHKADGGETTVENGAVIASLPHSYLHSLPRDQEEIINNMLRDYKQGKKFMLGFMQFSTEGIREPHQITFEEMGIGYETIRLEDNTEEDREFLDVTEGMSEEEIKEYEALKAKRREKAYSRFPKRNDTLETDIERPHAHLDSEWQSEILEDLEIEFNERNSGGYGR